MEDSFIHPVLLLWIEFVILRFVFIHVRSLDRGKRNEDSPIYADVCDLWHWALTFIKFPIQLCLCVSHKTRQSSCCSPGALLQTNIQSKKRHFYNSGLKHSIGFVYYVYAIALPGDHLPADSFSLAEIIVSLQQCDGH